MFHFADRVIGRTGKNARLIFTKLSRISPIKCEVNFLAVFSTGKVSLEHIRKQNVIVNLFSDLVVKY